MAATEHPTPGRANTSPYLHAEEDWIDASRNLRIGSSGVYETYCTTVGQLYRSMQSEYGRCTGKVHIDLPSGNVRTIGWVFVKRDRYEDTGETFLRETWVTVHEAPPTVETTYHYAELVVR